jgi:hypothetical protein
MSAIEWAGLSSCPFERRGRDGNLGSPVVWVPPRRSEERGNMDYGLAAAVVSYGLRCRGTTSGRNVRIA